MRVLGGASTLPRQPLLECNEDGHADNGYDVEHCNHGVHHAPCDEPRLQSVINYGLKFSGVVVTTIGRECGPINLKISVWPYIFKTGGRPSISRSVGRRPRQPRKINSSGWGTFRGAIVMSALPPKADIVDAGVCPLSTTILIAVSI